MLGEDTDRVKFIDRVTETLGRARYIQLVHAYQLYKALHGKQKRSDGSRYMTHPRAVAEILLDFEPTSYDEVIGALLHDTVEDAFILPEFILDVFGPDVANAVEVLSACKLRLLDHGFIEKTKLGKDVYFSRIAASTTVARRIKCADRIHNLRTMDSMGTDHQKKKVAETRRYIIPIAHNTDLRLANELERLCAQYEQSWSASS